MDKKQLTATEIRTKFITAALVGSSSSVKGNLMTQMREEVFFAKGREVVRGKTVPRGGAKKANPRRQEWPHQVAGGPQQATGPR